MPKDSDALTPGHLDARPAGRDAALQGGRDALERQAVTGEHAERISIVEETVKVAKEEVLGGRLRVRTQTETVEELAQVDLQDESLEVTRVPVGREVDSAPPVRTEGDLLVVPVLEERLVVVKQLVLAEELHIRRRVETRRVEEPVTLRRQRAVVERLDGEGGATEVEVERDGVAGKKEA